MTATSLPKSPGPGDQTAATPDLAHRASRGTLMTVGAQWSRTALQLVSTVVLARLLAPADFGLVAMVMAIVGVADLIREFGLSGAIVRLREIDDAMWAAIHRFSLGLGIVFGGLAAASAPLIAALYGEERLIGLSLALAPLVLVNSVAMPLQAGLQRELRFGTIAIVEIIAAVVGVAAAITAAALGAGVWSLVLLPGVSALVRPIGFLAIRRPSLAPARPWRDLRPVIGTGGSILGVELLNYAARNLDNVLIGRTLGPAVLGVYTRAYALLMLPISQLNGPLARVGLPVLSRLRDDEDAYRRYVRAAMLVVAYAAVPTFALLAALAGPLVLVVLGDAWIEAAPIFALLAIGGVAQALGNVSGWLYVSLGRAHRQLVYFAVTKPLVIAAFVVGLMWNGVHGLALLSSLLACVLLVPGFLLAIRGTFVTAADVFLPVLRPVLLAPFAFAAAAAVSALLADFPFLALAAGGLAGAAVFVLALLIPAYRRDVRRIVDVVSRARRSR
jgi:O-antigen/teichoic acid export membrane protein